MAKLLATEFRSLQHFILCKSMRPPGLLLSVRREFSVRARLLVALLALIQFIAPTWHVCEMGGDSCCPPQPGSETKLYCPLPEASAAATPAISTPPASAFETALCEHCPQQLEDAAPQLTVSATPAPHGENCLAKLLLGMPWQSVAPLELLEFGTSNATRTPTSPKHLTLATLPQPPSRAPPLPSI